jgi:argininosuccinate lyase
VILPSYHVVLGFVTDCSHRMHAFNESLKYDQRMHVADIRGSIAYAKALTLVGILTKEEETRIVQGLTAVGKEWESGQVDSVSSHDDLSYRSPYAVSGSAGR